MSFHIQGHVSFYSEDFDGRTVSSKNSIQLFVDNITDIAKTFHSFPAFVSGISMACI